MLSAMHSGRQSRQNCNSVGHVSTSFSSMWCKSTGPFTHQWSMKRLVYLVTVVVQSTAFATMDDERCPGSPRVPVSSVRGNGYKNFVSLCRHLSNIQRSSHRSAFCQSSVWILEIHSGEYAFDILARRDIKFLLLLNDAGVFMRTYKQSTFLYTMGYVRLWDARSFGKYTYRAKHGHHCIDPNANSDTWYW